MKTVSFEEYREFLLAHQELKDHVTEGFEIQAMQWLDREGKVQAQAVYWATQPGEPKFKTYQIRES